MITDDLRSHPSITLPPEASSVRRARAFVAAELADSPAAEIADGVVLAVSELVTNAVLHAQTDIEVVVVAQDGGVRIGVCDGHPGLPALRHYGDYATTGRGLGLVAALATEVGIETIRQGGKCVWFTVSLAGSSRSQSPMFDWDLDALLSEDLDLPESPRDSALLHDLPVVLWQAAQQHHDAVLRELLMHHAAHPETEGQSGQMARAQRAEAALASAIDLALTQALQDQRLSRQLPEGHPSPLPALPVSLEVPVDVGDSLAPAFADLQEVLDDAERLAADGTLLAWPALPEIIALRDWCCEQVVAQINGVPPAGWRGADTETANRSDSDRFQTDMPDWDSALVRDSERLALAADDNNRLIAVSASAAEMFGWEEADLIGRRVVTLVPPRYREAHVAGFTRHLTTGEAHALGIPVDLPVLHAQGREIVCTFLIEQHTTAQGRNVYVSWLTPATEPA